MKNRFYKALSLLIGICLFCACAAPVSAAEAQAEKQKVIAFTFDDGPNTGVCAQVLDVLKENDVVATFFVNAMHINENTAPVMKRMADEGHQIGSHGYNHKFMTSWTIEQIMEDWEASSDAIYESAGVRPTVMRWPNLSQPRIIAEDPDIFPYPAFGGMPGGPDDWNDEVDVQERIDKVVNNAQDGAIVLLHCFEGNWQTPEALETIIPELKAQGYEFVTLDELFVRQNCEPTLGVQWGVVPYTPVVTYGDVNDDGKINSKDSLLLRQYIADYDVEINELAADVYRTGKVNAADSLLLRQYIAKYPVELGKEL